MEKQSFQNFVANNGSNFLRGKADCLARQIFKFNKCNKEVDDDILSSDTEVTRSNEVHTDNRNVVENMEEDVGGIASFLNKRLEVSSCPYSFSYSMQECLAFV